MWRSKTVSLLVLGLALAALADPAAPGAAAPVTATPDDWLVFASADCDECRWLKTEFFPELARRCGRALPRVLLADIDDAVNYEVLLAVERALGGRPGTEFPAFLVGSRLVYGQAGIEAWARQIGTTLPDDTLPDVVLATLGRARLALHAEAVGAAVAAAPKPAPAATAGVPDSAIVADHRTAQILYFATTGCPACARAERQAAYAQQRVPGRRLVRIDALSADGRLLQYAVSSRLALPAPARLVTPMFVSGTGAVYGKNLSDADLVALFEAAPAAPFWAAWDESRELARARDQLRTLAHSFTVPTVIVAGLIDGVNPCAFAVIVFLVSYLTLTGGMGRRLSLLYGLIYAAGNFVCYFLIGLGFFRILDALQRWRVAGRVLFLGMGIVCLGFAVAAVVDMTIAVRRGAGRMKFGMPKALRGMVHRLIREQVGRHVLGLGAFALGFAVSGLELVCTGQIYLPVIIFINSTAPGRQSLVLLTVYNLAFVVPLLIVVGLGVTGLSSERLAQWAQRHAVLTRGMVGLIVFALALVMFWMAGR